MNRFKNIFKSCYPTIIGMIHVRPLPGTPNYISGSLNHTIKLAQQEAELYLNAGVDALMVENMHDVPYLNRNVGPEITSSMTAVASAVKYVGAGVPCGIQILAGCNKEALAVAAVSGLDFIRAEGFLFGHLADEGLMNADAGELLRYRKTIDAENVLVLTDLKKKHSSHAITSDVSLTEMCTAADFFMSDGVVLTGTSTGKPASSKELNNVLSSCNLPVLIGSGVTLNNFVEFKNAHGIIIGSHFKKDGDWRSEVCKERVESFMSGTRKYRRPAGS